VRLSDERCGEVVVNEDGGERNKQLWARDVRQTR
jgi:hypothetical protein